MPVYQDANDATATLRKHRDATQWHARVLVIIRVYDPDTPITPYPSVCTATLQASKRALKALCGPGQAKP